MTKLELSSLLLFPSGAIGRGPFVGGIAALTVASFAVDRVMALLPDSLGLLGFAFALPVAWSAGCLSRKRLHHMGWSGLFIAMFLAAYILAVLGAPFLPIMPGRAVLALLLLSGPGVAWLLWLAASPGIAKAPAPSAASPVILAQIG